MFSEPLDSPSRFSSLSFLSGVLFFSFVLLLPNQIFARNISSNTPMDTLLAMNLDELINVEVSLATRMSLPVNKAPAIATVVTAREIRNMGARNLLDILKRVPGLGVSITTVPIGHSIEVRGIITLNSEKVLIMVDGHSINEAMHSSSAFFSNTCL